MRGTLRAETTTFPPPITRSDEESMPTSTRREKNKPMVVAKAPSDTDPLDTIRISLAARIRTQRVGQRMSGVALARAAGISKAMLSKIESAERIPSVPVLAQIASALGLGVGDLFGSGIALSAPVHTPAGTGRIAVSEDLAGFSTELLGHIDLPGLQIQAMRTTMQHLDEPALPVQFDGFWIDVIESGEVVIQVGSRQFHLKPGDALTYRGEHPHALISAPVLPVRALTIRGRINKSAESPS
jgi:transcriptional regulator with XRE-family HTH domain